MKYFKPKKFMKFCITNRRQKQNNVTATYVRLKWEYVPDMCTGRAARRPGRKINWPGRAGINPRHSKAQNFQSLKFAQKASDRYYMIT